MNLGESVEQNLLEFFRHFARAHKSGKVAELDGVSIASSGLDCHMFNAAFFSGPVIDSLGDLERRIALASSHLSRRQQGWAFWACEGRLEGRIADRAAGAFERREMRFAVRHPGMASEALSAPNRSLASLEIRRVEQRQTRLALAHINAVAFGMPFDWCAELYDVDGLWNDDFAGYVGYRNGEAVTAAATLAAAEAIGVYCVATLPGHERKGCAEAVVRHAVAHGQQRSGLGRSILQSTPPGLPLYRRMGYEVVTHFSIYTG